MTPSESQYGNAGSLHVPVEQVAAGFASVQPAIRSGSRKRARTTTASYHPASVNRRAVLDDALESQAAVDADDSDRDADHVAEVLVAHDRVGAIGFAGAD